MTKDKKGLFLDMDGTTLDNERRISRENMEALKKVIQAGHEVVVTTGRPAASAGYLLKEHHLDEIGCRYVIAYNGGMLLDCVSNQVIFKKTLPLTYVKELADAARQRGIYIHTYEDDKVVTEREDENLAHYLNKTSMKAHVVKDMAKELKEEPCKMLAADIKDHESLEAFRDEMKQWAEGKVDMYFSCPEYLEIVPKGVCKGEALKAFCKAHGIAVEHAVAVGDEGNDISMIRAAGTGCAVANGMEEVKRAADYVTERDNDQSAIAEVVEKFVLP
ncbi:MAG TPA: Cof-type HAD-IIB family hydrolase [Lachnospiraceae bacterium]|nr:Cof-type HAD-IIB family hydrolase [Lachnospiraceae bacterium]